MWSRICTTCPENPHCGNCGVPFMNSTTSFDFTSLSMNCSMLISLSFGAADRLHGLSRPHNPSNLRLPYMYPKRLCIQSKLAVGASAHFPKLRHRSTHPSRTSESHGHSQTYDFSAAFLFGVPGSNSPLAVQERQIGGTRMQGGARASRRARRGNGIVRQNVPRRLFSRPGTPI